ncbi:MAG: hypothetical protein LBH43_15095, partial [Treponema sp.]|nr:hypothetical protein [Treponema sp.]
MFKGLTQRVQRILSTGSQIEARRFNSNQVLPEHVIIAMLREGAGTACKALLSLKIDLVEFRHTLEKTVHQSPGVLIQGELGPSDRTKYMLELATDEARSIGNDYLGTEHLLFAALREKDSCVQLYLNQRVVDIETLKEEVRTICRYSPDNGIFFVHRGQPDSKQMETQIK